MPEATIDPCDGVLAVVSVVGEMRRRQARHKLVVITPVYNESGNLERFVAETQRVFLSDKTLDAQVLFVDDGSTDDSWVRILSLCAQNPAYAGIRLSRNFGAHVALAAGFDHVSIEANMVATLACDLQDPPETVIAFVERWRAGADIVWGSRRERADGSWRIHASRLLESTLRRFAMPRDSKFQTGSFLLIDRKVVDCFLQYREQNRVTFALVAWTGFEQAVVNYDRRARVEGRSGWSIGQMLNTAYDVFIGFSPMPAKIVTGLGTLMFLLSVFGLIYLVVEWFTHSVQPGWTGIMAILMLFFGLLFMMVGLLAEYLYRIFVETKNRPLYFVASQTPVPLRELV